jgi:cold shock CspA family protein
MRRGTIHSIRPERGFGCMRDTAGAKVFFHRSALTPPARVASLAVGTRVEFEPESGPNGPRTATITVTPLETPPVLSLNELAAYCQRHAAGSIHDLTHLTRRWLMQVPQWLKPACWGIVVGAFGIMILGFTWWGWVLGSTAETMAKDRADGAVTAILAPIGVERFMGQVDAAAKLTEFQKGASWQQHHVIAQGGWATATGSNDPNAAVARACAQRLAHINT